MADDREDNVEVGDDSQWLNEVVAREAEVSKLLQRKDKLNALKSALYNPPVSAKSSEIKDRNAANVERVLSAIADAEIPTIVDGLDSESLDNLMKYVYKFMQKSTNCSQMLKLHASITDKAGVGSIIRVMTDRKQV